MPKVFISYSHDSEEHRDWVFSEIVLRLRNKGIECISDHRVNGFTPDGSTVTRWMEDSIEEADFVLVICTKLYYQRFRGHDTQGGRGVTFEGAIISQTLYDEYCKNKKFIVLIPDNGNIENIPSILKSCFYSYPQQYENVYRVITGQPEYELPPIGEIEKLPPRHFKSTQIKTNPSLIYLNRLPNTQGDFFGRNQELALLNDALINNQTIIVQFIAAGGTGKTKLLQYWLAQHKDLSVLAWSFYSQGASEDKQTSASLFFETLFDKLNADRHTFNCEDDKGEYLAELLMRQPCVLVLDGLEPLQHAGKGMRGELKDKGIRALLRQLLNQHSNNKVLCLITSRIIVQDLDGYHEVITKDLHNLKDNDGVDLLKSLGVKGSDKELTKAVKEYGNHALALSLLGNVIKRFYQGDIVKRDAITHLQGF